MNEKTTMKPIYENFESRLSAPGLFGTAILRRNGARLFSLEAGAGFFDCLCRAPATGPTGRLQAVCASFRSSLPNFFDLSCGMTCALEDVFSQEDAESIAGAAVSLSAACGNSALGLPGGRPQNAKGGVSLALRNGTDREVLLARVELAGGAASGSGQTFLLSLANPAFFQEISDSIDDAIIQRQFLSEMMRLPVFVFDVRTRRADLSFRPYSPAKEPIPVTLDSENFGIHPEDKAAMEAFGAKLQKNSHIYTETARIIAEDGLFHWIRVTAKTYFQDGVPKKIFGYIQEADEQRNQRIRDKTLDPLTSFYNPKEIRRRIIAELDTRLEIRRDGLVLLNFDNLADINEKLGRVFGDEILIFMSEKIAAACAKTDCLIGRISGDEFLLFFRDMKNDSALRKILDEIFAASATIYTGEVSIPALSVSAGVVLNSGNTDLKSLLEKARKAIYIQKINGKTGYMFYTPEMLYSAQMETEETEPAEPAPDDWKTHFAADGVSDMLLDIFSETKDLDSAVNLSMLKIAKLHNLAAIRLLELSPESTEEELTTTYDWFKNPGYEGNPHPVRLTHWEMIQLNKIAVPYVPKTAKILPLFTKILPDADDRSIAVGKLYDEGHFAGLLVFMKSRPAQSWSREELSTLRTFSKILSAYIEKSRAFWRATISVKKSAQIDALTGFYHYDDFRKVAEDIVKKDGGQSLFTVSAFDIRGFKYLNEFYGYAEGNSFLKNIAEYLSELPFFELGCRMVSDVFFILCRIPKKTPEKAINAGIYHIMEIFLQKQSHRYPRCNLKAVCGTALIPDSGVPAAKAIDNANTLRKEMKNEFRNCARIYSGAVAEQLEFRSHLVNSLPVAFANHEILFYLQPKVCLQNGKTAGAEALVRWKQGDRFIQPDAFIPALEENGLITMLDFYIYESVCKYIADRRKRGKGLVPISVNVSGVHLQSREFTKNLLTLVKKYQIPPELLEFELTETVFLDNLKSASQAFSVLKQEGFKISIDDFGSGHSSTTLLTEMPFDTVKMDKSLLGRGTVSRKNKIVLSSVIDMAAKLDITVLCEGAETKEQLDFLKTTACALIQGYYFSKPLPVDEFDRLIEEGHIFAV